MKIKTVLSNIGLKRFQSDFMKSKHVIFRDIEYACDIEGNKILCEVAEKDKLSDPTEIVISYNYVDGENYAQIVFDSVQPFGYMGMISPSFSIAAFLYNTYQCNQFVDVDTGKDVNILHRIGGAKMNVHNTSDTPVKHDLGIFQI